MEREVKGKRSMPLFLLLVLSLALGVGTWWLNRSGEKAPSAPQRLETEQRGEREAAVPLPPPPGPEVSPLRKQKLVVSPPRVAIIIDDLGYNDTNYRPFLELRYPLTFAVLPSLPYSRKIAREAQEWGHEVLLHLPLEPHEYPRQNPGKGMIRCGMTAEEIRLAFREDLRSIPGAVGVSNHMGSRAMEDPETMKVLMEELKRRRLYFVDSLTTNRSMASPLAQEAGVPLGKRSVFLDNYRDPAYIERQLRILTELARKQGGAIGVGHPYAVTASVLREHLPQLARSGIELVPASHLVH
jgi:polysaccharide deacetylase 2 family uncharacterized protein YibQ